MPVVELPEGARTIAQDGSNRYTGRRGDKVRVTPGQAAALERFRHTGPTHGERYALGTKAGRWCGTCLRLWNAWSMLCPRCGEATEHA